MSDLLSPILYVVQNEVDAFWCFCGFMALVVRLGAGVAEGRGEGWGATPHVPPPQHGNFEESQETMKRQLGQLLLLLRVLDPPLCDFLGTCLGAGAGAGAAGTKVSSKASGNEQPQTVSGTFGPDPKKRNIWHKPEPKTYL